MKKTMLLCAVAILPALFGCYKVQEDAKDLVIVENGQSRYQIVIPEPNGRKDDLTDRNLKETADLLQECIEKSTGAKLPVVTEGRCDSAKPGIYIGNTVFARSKGVDTSVMRNWKYLEQSDGENLILAGLDERGPAGKERTYYSMGSMKSVTSFLQEHMGVKFVLPGKNGTSVPKMSRIAVPSRTLLRQPNIEFNIGVHPANPYSIANNLYNAPYFNSHGGHSYYDAVPASKYGAAHPEYFAMNGGKRNPAAHHLCISNPDVQELIYQELVTELDRGFEMTELGQTDGFVPCSCDKCKALYGVSDPGEKLWILHRSFAERLKKERPGKRIVILAYGPTRNPPKTFSSFPDNVMIELCAYSPEEIAAWKKLDVPGGFMAYIYNWGDYQIQGLTAKFGPQSCEKQIMLFSANQVKGIYRCGFGELFGMEGPLYYAWGRGFDRPGKDTIRPLLDEFYAAAYGPARAPMKKFFTTLYDRLDYFESAQKSEKPIKNPITALSLIYTPDVVLTMEKNLERAESMAGLSPEEQARIHLVKVHFEYTRTLARIMNLYSAFRMEPSKDIYEKLAVEIEKRNGIVERIVKKQPEDGRVKGWNECSDYSYCGGYVKSNGRLSATINAPLNWDIKKFREKNIVPTFVKKAMEVSQAREKIGTDGDFEAGAWKNAPWNTMESVTAGNKTPARFKVVHDDNALYVGFDCVMPKENPVKYTALGHDGAIWEQECLEILIDVEASRERYFHFIFNPSADSFYESARGYIEDPLHPLYNRPDVSWNGKWEYYSYLDQSAGTWKAVAKIPFSTLGLEKAPEPGSRWTANFGREHIPSGTKDPQLLLWSPSPETSSFHDPDSYSEINFK